MSHKLTCSVSGWGSVQNPLNDDERLLIEDGVLTVEDDSLADALAEEYGPLSRDEESSEPADDVSESEDSQETSDDEQPTCAGNDGECSRPVESEGSYCWQHSDDE